MPEQLRPPGTLLTCDNLFQAMPLEHAHQRLDLFRLSRDFAIELYKHTRSFPARERFGLTSQIRRAGIAIPANIAEGAARRSKKEFLYFLSVARGSATELEVLLEIARATEILDPGVFEICQRNLERILAMTNGLIRKADAR